MCHEGRLPKRRIRARISGLFWIRTALDVSLIWDVVARTEFFETLPAKLPYVLVRHFSSSCSAGTC